MFDSNALGVLIGIVKSIPGTAANRAETAQASAEDAQAAAESAAELAATRNYGVSVSGNTLTFTQNTSDGD